MDTMGGVAGRRPGIYFFIIIVNCYYYYYCISYFVNFCYRSHALAPDPAAAAPWTSQRPCRCLRGPVGSDASGAIRRTVPTGCVGCLNMVAS